MQLTPSPAADAGIAGSSPPNTPIRLRPCLAASVALVGASLMAITPVASGLPNVDVAAIQLLSGADPLTSFEDVFQTAQANATQIYDYFSAAPFVAEQQEIANDIGYLQDLAKDPSSFSTVLNDFQTEAQTAFNAATFLGGDQATFINPLSNDTMDISHALIYLGLTGQAAALGIPAPPAPIPTIVDFLSSPASGMLIGELGPVISPLVALDNSIQTVIGDLTGSAANPEAALQALLDTPANVLGGFLNGATLNLDSLIPLIEQANLVPLPPGASLDSLSFAFGGLLSPGETSGLGVTGAGIGGSIFNSVGLDLSGVPIFGTIDAPGQGIGPLGAFVEMEQVIATALGWSGTGNPLDGLFDAGTTAAAIDPGAFTDLLTSI